MTTRGQLKRSSPNDSVGGPLIFVSYSHKDAEAQIKLDTHMAQLKREGAQVWFDGDLIPGGELDPAIFSALKRADIFVALASPDYLHSTYCFDKEYGYAIRKAARKKLHVVVALLRACQWRHTRMARYKLLPRDGKPVDQWARRGDAYEEIVEGIRAILKESARERSVAPVQKPAQSRRARATAQKVPRSAKVSINVAPPAFPRKGLASADGHPPPRTPKPVKNNSKPAASRPKRGTRQPRRT